MINNYEIRNINGEEVLFLYFDLDSEFAKINFKEKYNSIEKYVKKFIKDNKIAFAGSTAVIIIGGSIIGNILLNKDMNKKYDTYALRDRYQEIISGIPSEEYLKDIVINEENSITDEEETIIGTEESNTTEEVISNENINVNTNVNNSVKEEKIASEIVNRNNNVNNNSTSSSSVNETVQNNSNNNISEPQPVEEDNNTYITIQRSNGQMVKLELEEYITGVVASEMPALFHPEALKAQAIIARTYALKAISRGQVLTDSNSTQSYKDNNQLKSLWGGNFNSYYNKIKDASHSTEGMYLTYNGSYIEAVYHSTSNGKTENSINGWGNYYPYLISVDSQYDNLNPSFLVKTSFTYEKLSSLLGIEINSETEFNIIDKTEGDRVKTIEVNGKTYSGTSFRNLLGLRSADFDIEKNDSEVIITTRGYGHGVGMSQYGANGMAKNGYSYSQILSHYYPGTVISS